MDLKHRALLRLHDAGTNIPPEELEAIAAAGEVIHLKTGEMLHTAGAPVEAMHIVLQGRLKLVLNAPGEEPRTIRFVSAGDQVGGLMVFTDEPNPLDVIVDERVVLLELPKDAVAELVDQYPKFRRNLMRKLGMGVREALHRRKKRTRSKIVTFFGVGGVTLKPVQDIIEELLAIGERIGIISDAIDAPHDSRILFKTLRDAKGNLSERSEIQNVLKDWPTLDRILFVLDPSHPMDRAKNYAELSDRVFVFADTERADRAAEDLKRLVSIAPSWSKKTAIAWILRGDEQIAPIREDVLEIAERDFKVRLPASEGPSLFYKQDLDRMVHLLRGVSIGIALSGGAAHGMAHLGVLQALDEVGITIDRMAGTSAGVLTGVVYAAGYTPRWCSQRFSEDLEPGRIYKWFPKGDGLYVLEKYRTGSWDRMLRKYLHDWKLEQLPIPISTITTDLISASQVVRQTGDAVDSILESINLPVIAPPIARDGMLLVDGGVVNNLPADLLDEQSCNCVIGVDVAAHIEQRIGENTAATSASDMDVPGAVATMLRCLRVQAHNLGSAGAEPADVMIAPDVSMYDATAFSKTMEMADIGYDAAMQQLPTIKKYLNRLDRRLFPESS